MEILICKSLYVTVTLPSFFSLRHDILIPCCCHDDIMFILTSTVADFLGVNEYWKQEKSYVL